MSRRTVSPSPVSRAAGPCLVVGLLLWSTAAVAQQNADRAESDARDWVSSIAGVVFAAAWPTATYEGFRLRQVDRLPDGLSTLVRLTGESGFGGNLWVDLAFIFRQGQLFDVEVRGHNAILVGPFQTTKTMAALTMEFAQEFAAQQSSGGAGSASAAAGKADPDLVEFFLVPGDGTNRHLALYRNGVPDRTLGQPFAADTRIAGSELISIGSMQIVRFVASDDEWRVQYWWHLETDGLYYAARDGSGRLATSENFETGGGTVGERMRRLVLEPWLRGG